MKRTIITLLALAAGPALAAEELSYLQYTYQDSEAAGKKDVTVNLDCSTGVTSTGVPGVIGATGWQRESSIINPAENPDVHNSTVNVINGGSGYLIGSAATNVGSVSGNATLNFMSGSATYLVGGNIHYYNYDFVPTKSTGDVTVNLTGGQVDRIHGGSYFAGGQNDLRQYITANGGHSAFAMGGDVYVNVRGGKVTGRIHGAGSQEASVDGTVHINISGDAEVHSIWAGARNNLNIANDLPYVGATDVCISGGKVDGSVYGGGYRDGGNKTLVKGDTNITLSGGIVTGNVYAGGQDDIINGNTNVTVLGTGTQVTGTVSGGGDNSTIAGDRNLNIGTNDTAAACALSIKDFDNLVIAAGSEATLTFSEANSQMTLDNLALLVDSDNESAKLTLNNIAFDSFTLIIELTDEQISSVGTTFTFSSLSLEGVNLSDIETDVLFVDSQGNAISTGSENVTYDNNTGSFTVTASIPEPTTATLSLLALAGLAARRRRK